MSQGSASVLTNGLIAIGIFVGVCATILVEFFIDIFGTSFEPSEAIVGGLFGALVALSGTVLTLAVANETSRSEVSARHARVISSIYVKYLQIFNNIYSFRQHIRDSYAAVSQESHQNPGLFVSALTGFPDYIRFSSEEKALLLELKEFELSNDINQWGELHNSLIKAFETYARLRTELTSQMPAKMVGQIGTSLFTREEFDFVAAKLAQLNSLAVQLSERCEKDVEESLGVLERVRLALKRHAQIDVRQTFAEDVGTSQSFY